jgi:hypothetical protein
MQLWPTGLQVEMRTALLPQDIRALFSCHTVGALLRMLDEHGHQVKERQGRVVLPWKEKPECNRYRMWKSVHQWKKNIYSRLRQASEWGAPVGKVGGHASWSSHAINAEKGTVLVGYVH